MIGLLLKLFASAIQQKVIGEQLSHYVSVRQTVGVNSTLIKAMRLVVGSNGLSIPKVALLVGGPDWPVSNLDPHVATCCRHHLESTDPSILDFCPLWDYEAIVAPNHARHGPNNLFDHTYFFNWDIFVHGIY